MPIQDALIEAERWYQNNRPYSKMDKKYFGVKTLSEKCSDVLFQIIKQNIPEIKNQINQLLRESKEQLKPLKDLNLLESKEQKTKHLIGQIFQMKSMYAD